VPIPSLISSRTNSPTVVSLLVGYRSLGAYATVAVVVHNGLKRSR